MTSSSGTPLTAMTALEPLTTNLAAYTYTNMENDGSLAFKIAAETDSWATWTAEVANTSAYVVTDTDTTNAAKFSAFFLSLTFTAGGSADDGVCFVSSKWGTVCLLDTTSAVDTYRVSTSDWTTATAEATYADLITSVKGITGSKQESTEWFDKFYCSGSTPSYTCSAWQPDWMDPGLTQGYPRFGSSESTDGELSYLIIDADSGALDYAAEAKTWTIEGSFSLVASAVVALSVALTF